MLLCTSWGLLKGQDLSGAERERFIADQDKYLEKLNLNIDQRKAYHLLTVRYDKQFISVERSNRSKKEKKKLKKTIRKAKDTEMRAILNDYQYKLYLERQSEIEKNYSINE
jgi:hypothetical protein